MNYKTFSNLKFVRDATLPYVRLPYEPKRSRLDFSNGEWISVIKNISISGEYEILSSRLDDIITTNSKDEITKIMIELQKQFKKPKKFEI